MEVGGQCHTPAVLLQDQVAIVCEAGWAPGPVWMGAENLTPPQGFEPQAIQPLASHRPICNKKNTT